MFRTVFGNNMDNVDTKKYVMAAVENSEVKQEVYKSVYCNGNWLKFCVAAEFYQINFDESYSLINIAKSTQSYV